MAKSPDRIGQVIGQRYDLTDVIGRGGQGTVYRAFDRWSNRAVAVKVLASKMAREAQMVERLMREQQALTALKGTAAVEVFDLCRGDEGELCLVMELLQGTDLDEHLDALAARKQRMALDRVGEIFDPIVTTLETAHAAGILHRDLKPANIFLLEGGGVRLLDFGMARLKNAAPLTAAGMVMGSPSFMAPEAWKGLSDLLDRRVDVYSLGVILFLVLTNELPIRGANLHEVFTGATTAKRPSLRQYRPDLPRRADEWAARALALNREERFGSARELWDAFVQTFHVRLPNRPSLWAKAKGAVQKMAGSQPPPAAPRSPPPSPTDPDHPSYAREALARTALHVNRADEPSLEAKSPEKTLDITENDFVPQAPPPRRPPPAARPTVEKTLSISVELVVDPTSEDVSARPPHQK